MKLFVMLALMLSTQKPLLAEPITLETPTGILYGTLELPKTAQPCPVALIIAGSGPTDRNGNSSLLSSPNNSLKLLAEGLAAQSIASVRYDRRGIGESAKAEPEATNLRFDTLVNDAVLWCRQLRSDKRFSTVAVIGHSEGALTGMVAAQTLDVDVFVSLAGVSLPGGQGLLEQLRPHLSPDLMKEAETIVKSLDGGKTTESVPPALAPLFALSVQPYLISLFRYDPIKEIGKLSIPVLVVQGTTDIQKSIDDAKRLAEAKPSAQLLIIVGMNHILKEVPKDREKQLSSYSDPTLPVVPKLISEVGSFIGAAKRKAANS